MSHLIGILFGSGTWGAGGNFVAAIVCGLPASVLWVWHHRRTLRRELAELERRLTSREEGSDDHPVR